MKNELLKLISIQDKNAFIKNVITNGDTKIIEIATYPVPHYCEKCGCKLRSKGIEVRTIKYPAKIVGFNITIIFHQRRYKCHECGAHKNEDISFASKHN